MLAKSARLCSTSYSRYARIFAGALSPVSNSGLYWLFFLLHPAISRIPLRMGVSGVFL